MNNDYGLLLKERDIKLQRKYFDEMCTMVGIRVIHRAPRAGKNQTVYSEID